MGIVLDATTFQSHAGSIEAKNRHAVEDIQRHRFNPTLVRLRHRPDGIGGRGLQEFQSHAGSIEAAVQAIVGFFTSLCFNPTLVRLRRGEGGPDVSKVIGFNPTLVRLRRFLGGLRQRGTAVFQSHAGSIEATQRRTDGSNPVSFQSHAGSIEAI